MSEFQSVVNRQFTLGFPGEIVRDGTLRAKPGRLKSATALNAISRAFTYSDLTGSPTGDLANGVGYAGVVASVECGGAGAFFGILAHPKHYALTGTIDGSLAPTMTVLQNSEAEFVDSTAGILVEIFNETTTAKAVAYGWKVAFMPKSVADASADNAQGLPAGALVVYTGGTVPAKCIAIPNAFVSMAASLGASAAGAPVSGVVMIQMAN